MCEVRFLFDGAPRQSPAVPPHQSTHFTPMAWKSDNFSGFILSNDDMQGLSRCYVAVFTNHEAVSHFGQRRLHPSWLLRVSAAQRAEKIPCLSSKPLLGSRIIIRSTRREIHALSYEMMETNLTQNVTLKHLPVRASQCRGGVG